ncbi:MAG: acyl carrier protein [Planctomycetaceae bacterium]|jgi:acyl carrier protein|nr:acyl carrier protein [Planctomycetaceae bacterium]MDC0273987.1 acyl carrier protein [Planctomycetaceae bacterium]MDG2391263.1 acyl carrier protein [Planctomycetaceae bacterium]
MKTLLIALFSMLVLSGCDSSKPVGPTNISDAQEEITFIRSTLATQLNVPEEQLKSDVLLGKLNPPMDEMALVNLVMAIEQKYDVTLSEDKLLASKKPNQHHLMLEQNTLNKLAIITHDERNVAESSPGSTTP